MNLWRDITEKSWERTGDSGGLDGEVTDRPVKRVALRLFLCVVASVFFLLFVAYQIRMDYPDWRPMPLPSILNPGNSKWAKRQMTFSIVESCRFPMGREAWNWMSDANSPVRRISQPSPCRLISRSLRGATDHLHRDLDRLLGCFKLGEPAHYRRFLQASAATLIAIEQLLESAGVAQLLPDWAERTRRELINAICARTPTGTPRCERLEIGIEGPRAITSASVPRWSARRPARRSAAPAARRGSPAARLPIAPARGRGCRSSGRPAGKTAA